MKEAVEPRRPAALEHCTTVFRADFFFPNHVLKRQADKDRFPMYSHFHMSISHVKEYNIKKALAPHGLRNAV